MAFLDKLKQVSGKIADSLSTTQEQLNERAEILNPAAKNILLERENKRLEAMLPGELSSANQALSQIENECARLKIKTSKLKSTIEHLDSEIAKKKKNLIILDNETLYQDFGLYTPLYDLMNAEAYKEKITFIRTQQKNLIKFDNACSYSENMTLNNSLSQGQKMVKDNVKQVLRTFNNECEMLISKVKFNNIESIRNRIIKSKESLEKLNKAMEIKINNTYLNAKLQELNLCYEYSAKKQEEKEEAKEERARLREEAKLQREIEESRKSIKKEQTHYENALKKLEEKIKLAEGIEKEELLKKRQEFIENLIEIDKSIKEIDYREANKRAGYVYIISNIGSFGKDIYKIGMTRRLEPLDRVHELGDASVPFNFDVHAMIFSEDAPGLETALHQAFENRKINMVNQRREFFKASLDEIEAVIRKNYDKTVDFIRTPEAEQYRETLMLRRKISTAI